jgi:hypothetical protein
MCVVAVGKPFCEGGEGNLDVVALECLQVPMIVIHY